MNRSCLLLAFGLTGCGSQAEVCDEMAVYSVRVQMVDQNANALQGASVSYSVDGGETGECEAFDLTSFGCGVEESGTFEIRATHAGYEDAVGTVTVTDGPCHVVAHNVTLVMAPVVCSGDPVAAVFATVTSASGAELTGVTVEALASGATARTACVEDASGWACAPDDLSGSFTLFANADGVDEVTTQVDDVASDADGCHPVTAVATLTFP
ncbi:hypothetical protein LBMAG42_00530 [Deltaproteobacteria bacterium]|nr:hypothetical protein LBMAG42_00530 [Deltaproteobacteria bacterium]